MCAVDQDVDRERDERPANDLSADSLRAFPRSFIDVRAQSPLCRAARRYLDDTVGSEAHQNDAAGKETGDERAERLEAVIEDRDVAKVDATPHGQLSCCDLRHTTSCPLCSSGLRDQIPFHSFYGVNRIATMTRHAALV